MSDALKSAFYLEETFLSIRTDAVSENFIDLCLVSDRSMELG